MESNLFSSNSMELRTQLSDPITGLLISLDPKKRSRGALEF
ncbi:unnamed protein product [Acidithrix sp. C25]|nr:unnamed protein product [Acidithrix sp. C25]